MTRKRRRAYLLLTAMICLSAVTALTLAAFQDTIVFFYSPSDLATRPQVSGQRIRVGGLVVAGSIERQGPRIRFQLTDQQQNLTIAYTGLLPDLFREGQGIVAQGRLSEGGIFQAEEILAKHDERYMPPEVVDALKRSGAWKHQEKNSAP